MTSKRYEMMNSIMSAELLLIYEDYSDYIRSSLVKRAVRSKVEAATESFITARKEGIYKKNTNFSMSICDKEALYPLLDNTIIDDQASALKTFKCICYTVLEEYSNNRVSISHYLSLVEGKTAKTACDIISNMRSNRSATVTKLGQENP